MQEDNAPWHTAKIITKYLANKKVKRINWPPQLPDLNPIKNLWKYIKARNEFVSAEMVLNYVAQHSLGLPRSYLAIRSAETCTSFGTLLMWPTLK